MRQPYPGYQSSRVEWLGDLPEHWAVRRLGTALAETVGGGTPDTGNESYWAEDDEEGLPWVAIADMSAGGEVATTAKRVTSLGRAAARLRPLPAGTIIYSMYASVGAVARLSMSAATNQAILGLVPGEMIESSFLYWWLTGVRKPVLSLTRDNTQSNLNAETVCKIPLALPPVDEQRSISAFLDHETAKIDTLVAKKRLLLERLAEYRTALITRTVTKGLPPDAARAAGLNPTPRLKPSGVEWLGDIPEHWGLPKLGRLGSFFKGGGGTKEDEIEGGLPCIRYGDLYTRHEFLIRSSRAGIAEESIGRYRLLSYGDILFAGSGETIEEIGKSAANLLEGPAYCGGDVIGFRPSIDADATFFGYATDCATASYQKACMGRGVTVMHIYSSELKYMLIPVPPLREQRAIAEFLNSKLMDIDTLSSRVETAIERLQEYRTALVTAAVTGKIDVRELEQVQIGASRT